MHWALQAQTVVKGVRLSAQDWQRTRCLLVDAKRRVIAASDGALVAFARTPGYETYPGLGWYGVIVQQPAGRIHPARRV